MRKRWQNSAITPISPNLVADQVTKNGKFSNPDKSFSRTVVKDLKLHSSHDNETNPHLQTPFTLCELNNALNSLKSGKAPGPDGIHNEFLVHSGKKLKNWLLDFLNLSFSTKIIPKMWRRVKVVAILKPGKDPN